MTKQAWLAFAKDLFAAVVCSLRGGPAGWFVLLGIVSLFTGVTPKKGDDLATPDTLLWREKKKPPPVPCRRF